MAQSNFHFTLGPVQGFVAQARRTRDFWAGSFLLSWLSGVAIAEIQRQKGIVKFPIPSSDYIAWIRGKKTSGMAPRQGGIPNRFKAISAEVPVDFNGELLAQTVRDAWLALADHVWTKDHLDSIESPKTKEIWQRQHANFWDISWALTADENASSLLDQRKNWRSHYAQAEPGVKCMVMDGWQELSGAERPGLMEKGQATQLSKFWQTLRDSGKAGMKTDLAKDEHLCAMAYVKRRFVRHFASFTVTFPNTVTVIESTTNSSELEDLTLKGWELNPGMPSVSYMAAVHWLEQLVKHITPDELRELCKAAKAVNPSLDEWETKIACLSDIRDVRVKDDKLDFGLLRTLLSLDGNLFFEHVQEHAKAYDYDLDKMEAFTRQLASCRHAHAEIAAAPSPFYAVLLMDGDSLGVHMSDKDNQEPISNALQAFTDAVPAIVERHNGFLIYAGGDDVLALLPLEDAMQCAVDIRSDYLSRFKLSPKITTSISAAIQYAHVKMPLGKVLGDAHGLLDDIAKDGAGRDALAVRVWKTGGMVLEWAQPWDIVLKDGNIVLETLASDIVKEGTEFSGKFFHKIRERFDLLNPEKNADGSNEPPVLNEQEAKELLAVDFKNSGNNRELSVEEAISKIGPLLEQCRAVKRDATQKKDQWKKCAALRPDGALLVRFLAQKGVGR
jgi:CRISPR-associated protein Cmr2